MALDSAGLVQWKSILNTPLQAYMRMLRSLNVSDPRATAKSRYQDSTAQNNSTVQAIMVAQIVTLSPGCPLAVGGLSAAEFNECVDQAAASL